MSPEVRVRYDSDTDRPLSDIVLDAIAEAKEEDLTKETCVLYDDVNPTALDHLFRESGDGNTTVTFDSLDVGVTLQGNGGIEVRATPLSSNEETTRSDDQEPT